MRPFTDSETMTTILNDVHSQLNATAVAHVVRPASLAELQAVIRRAPAEGAHISVAGGRHAMGGQQFSAGSLHIDMTGLDRMLNADAVRGLLQMEAGAQWPEIIAASQAMTRADGTQWGIRQKQTGVDAVTLGGSISANAHGRGLLMQPLGEDIEDLTLVTARGEVLLCSRYQHAELFSLAIGGYGLFGVIYAATLRLSPRRQVQRIVDIVDLDDAMHAVYRRAEEGCLYGDFQFAIDPQDDGFLRRGVFACYKPSTDSEAAPDATADLPPDSWLTLLKLAHEDKQAAFRLYAQHYLKTDGNRYWSDTMQLSTYIPNYADFLESSRGADAGDRMKETLVIGEHYVPRDQLLNFMQQARDVFRALGTEVIYGTIRAILRDTTAFLPWAKDDYACVIFNVRTPHDAPGMRNTADTFRALIDAATRLGGSFFLTYHRYASAAQVEACYPQFRTWLQLKRRYDPDELFLSAWYRHYRDAFAAGDGGAA
ncbi:FAD-binding oxidoreductase [Janthinobacterium sp. 17J80-10]|uniref:FAD-binding oxidoreductase n=1 Tax=Janthinobacterium sp. 17J80-10 TaxID=2497863 RepID=UPI0010055F40|nr:FAD-binding oxidoreductase [Janthinobacterium sp. 17J80-10]QAU32948.1 FAD-binding oxidoreductase [Janthinobacterium sp. 17J80-10]